MKLCFAFVALAACNPFAIAQEHTALPNPADPAARVPQATYHSVFAAYASYREQDLAAWREINDEVASIGGHAKIFGGAGQPPARSAPQAPQSGHKGH